MLLKMSIMKVGDGQECAVVEAMKMQNSLSSGVSRQDDHKIQSHTLFIETCVTKSFLILALFR